MIISDRKVKNLEKINIVIPTYRVLSTHELLGNTSNRYEYYSITLKHHVYFLVRKIFKKIEASYDIFLNNPRDRHLAEKINEIIDLLERDDTFQIGDKYLWCESMMFDLLEKNAYSNKYSHAENLIERADSGVYGGGYGLKGLWLTLFNLLTYCSDENILSNKDIIEYFREFSRLLELCGPGNLKGIKQQAGEILLRDKTPIVVYPTISEDFSKEIENTLNSIVKNNLVKPHSDLAKTPDKVTNEVLKTYQENRKLILNRIKK